jgi:hypothetical protein
MIRVGTAVTPTAAIGRKKSVLNGPGSVYMLDAVNEKLLPSREEGLLHSRYQALLGISEATAVHEDLNQLFHVGIMDMQKRSYGRCVVTEGHIRGC